MLNLTTVHPTWKSPPSDASRLSAEVVPRELLTRSDLRQMYELLEAYFENTSYRRFEQDLGEKDEIILLRASEDAPVVGFSTLMKLALTVGTRRVVGFFSGDTIIAREHWGSSLLGRLWLKTVFSAADRIQMQSPDTLLYWFLICSGYKTWRYLPVFFRDYSPHPDRSASAFDHEVLRMLATKKFGDEYDRAAGVIRFQRANPLRQGVAEITEQRLRDPMVEFFVRMNPGHAGGDELACLAPISRSNLTPAGIRLLRAGAEG
jgi:hypothetical protein